MTGARVLQVMEAVWRLAGAMRRPSKFERALSEELHDSTVRTVLRVLESKGYLRHVVRGKTYYYSAVIERQKAQRRVLRRVLARFFSGSGRRGDPALRLIEDERITAAQLDELRLAAPSPRERGKGRSGSGEKSRGGRQ